MKKKPLGVIERLLSFNSTIRNNTRSGQGKLLRPNYIVYPFPLYQCLIQNFFFVSFVLVNSQQWCRGMGEHFCSLILSSILNSYHYPKIMFKCRLKWLKVPVYWILHVLFQYLAFGCLYNLSDTGDKYSLVVGFRILIILNKDPLNTDKWFIFCSLNIISFVMIVVSKGSYKILIILYFAFFKYISNK